MIRKLNVTVANRTWPTSGTPSFPVGFHHGSRIVDIDVSAMLLLVGHLTTPTLSSGVSLSEFWAWVRYFYAVSGTSDLRLTNEFADLDSHQKTILSDDFGMGVPMSWLIAPLRLTAWCNGRDFVNRFSALTARPPPTPKKRGPTKSPDFVCLDQYGKFHVIECKGTQSGTTVRNRQLSHSTSSGTPSGGIVQKHMIVLQPGYQGQRLACGLSIGREGGSGTSGLRIVDPDGDERLEIGESEVSSALDPIIRGSVARALRASGLRANADLIASPSGREPDARPYIDPRLRHLEQARQRLVQERREQARSEIAERIMRQSFQHQRIAYIGRKVRIDLPRPLLLHGKSYSSVEIRQGVPRDVLSKLSGNPLEDHPIMETAPWLREELGGISLTGGEGRAQLFVGNLFLSELRLRS